MSIKGKLWRVRMLETLSEEVRTKFLSDRCVKLAKAVLVSGMFEYELFKRKTSGFARLKDEILDQELGIIGTFELSNPKFKEVQEEKKEILVEEIKPVELPPVKKTRKSRKCIKPLE